MQKNTRPVPQKPTHIEAPKAGIKKPIGLTIENGLCVFLLIASIFQVSTAFSQGEWNNWFFGNKAGLSFLTNPPTAVLNSGLGGSGAGGMAVASDSAGQLLFYANPISVYNRNHTLMYNGNNVGMGTGMLTSSIFAAPFVGNSNLYYLFTSSFTPGTGFGLFYSVIDMQLDQGLGGVVPGQKLLPVAGGEMAEPYLIGIRHQNKRDFWLISWERNPNPNAPTKYLVFLVDKNGIHLPVVSYSNTGATFGTVGRFMAINQAGTEFIGQTNFQVLQRCHFDASTGVITPLYTFQIPAGGTSYALMCFSWSGRKLYVSQRNYGTYPNTEHHLYQFDASLTDSTEFVHSMVQIMDYNYYGLPRLGKDSKIYLNKIHDGMSGGSVDSLSIIHNPDQPGMLCNFEENGISLQGRLSGDHLPSFLQRYFAYINHTGGLCQQMPVTFAPNTWPPPDSLWWNFGDPASGTANFSNDSTPQHTFSAAGTYTVQMIVRHVDMRYDTASLHLTIEPQPSPDLGPDRTVCENQTVVLDAGYNPQWSYQWNGGQTTNSIATNTTGTYSVTVTSPNGCSGSDEVTITILPGNTPQPKPIRHN
ncbi:MAG: PKD domain-containing protein [Bacteroidales bacterium]|nr:PKD domain-containing protein [Bacteroidales bacterium]MDD3666968.1 PKD domain-containing protein [Bacteroidales bacterium]